MTAPPPHLTLIVASTLSMGIGRASTLPWPPLRAEMAYFARVTRRCPPGHINAVIMGRKTWDSIPAKFRPLRGRVNVVVTRKGLAGEHARAQDPQRGPQAEGPWTVGSIQEGVELLLAHHSSTSSAPPRTHDSTAPLALARIFVIGGADIYAAALQLPAATRILLTRVYTDFECDTYFPVRLQEPARSRDGGKELETGNETCSGGERAAVGQDWVQTSKAELDAWVGECVPDGRQSEAGVEWEYELWERKGKEMQVEEE